jgi:hypothetical protein
MRFNIRLPASIFIIKIPEPVWPAMIKYGCALAGFRMRGQTKHNAADDVIVPTDRWYPSEAPP